MSTADAKARLLEVGRKGSVAGTLLASPAVRAGALLVAGALLGRVLGKRSKDSAATSLRRIAMRAGLAAAPLLVGHFVRAMSQHAPSRNGRTSEESPTEPGRL